jgi:hypothetical protein
VRLLRLLQIRRLRDKRTWYGFHPLFRGAHGRDGISTLRPGNDGLGAGIFHCNSFIFNGFRDRKDGISDGNDGLGNRLNTALRRVRTAEEQNRRQPGSNGSRNENPRERSPLLGGSACRGRLPCCGSTGSIPCSGSPGSIPAGSELLKDALRKRSFLPFQLVFDYFFPVFHHCCSFK